MLRNGYRVFVFLIVPVLVSFPGIACASGSSVIERLLDDGRSPFGGLRNEVGGNDAFFEHSIDRHNLDAIKSVAGRKLFDDLHLEDMRGKSMDVFITDNRRMLRRYPFILGALVRDLKQNDDIVLHVRNDETGDDSGHASEADVADPAAIIPADDIYRYTRGPNAGPRAFRRFLAGNYGLENKPIEERPDQIEAYSVFNNIVSGLVRKDLDDEGNDRGREGLPDSTDSSVSFDYLTDYFVHDSAPDRESSRPGTNAPGLFLPSKSTLDRMKNLLKIRRELKFARQEGRRPDFSGIDPDVLRAVVEASGLSSADELARLSDREVKKKILALVTRTVKKELERNDYVFRRSGVAHVGGTVPVVDPAGPGPVNPTFAAGNVEATREVRELRRRFMGTLTEAERTRLEMDNGVPWHLSVSPADLENAGNGRKVYHIFGPDMRDGFLNLPGKAR